jgi:acyl-CoA thioester hydrolase
MTQAPADPSPFSWPVRVYYEDTDAAGVVFYANYLRFMERARTEWLRSLGFEQGLLRRELGILFVVRRADLRFHRSAKLDDLLSVSADLDGHSRTAIDFSQSIIRDQDGEPCCSATVNIACLDAESMRPTRIPQALLTAMTAPG